MMKLLILSKTYMILNILIYHNQPKGMLKYNIGHIVQEVHLRK